MGRPPSDDPRHEHLAQRYTTGERRELEQAARLAGKDTGVYIRERALAAARRGRR